ncbi:LysR family transcriptional regulator [Mesorhizobium sp. 113-1-2]|uniref:LysR family transcriptional regulator n=1 Tax=Mesorhizobium sp. 113-1-2 TaxID=2744515 RepID=UPI00081984BD|nr:LysR family transcriptional regulator [Mesorhizobium sp. 113-1-2]BAV50864.1 Putative transcriptional regulator, LysR family [Mesorhizobium loti]BCG75399.1 LysR family transcriptional regulator [Mesorhizobium sp. 113-1-2]
MDRLEAMSFIIAIMESGSLSAASRRLGKSIPTVSRRLSELEEHLKAELFQRSSRQLKLTDAGRGYIEACKRIIEQIDDAEREVSGEYVAPKGDLTATAPWGFGHMHLLPLACEFMRAYPDIRLRLVLSDRVLNPREEMIDVAIRIGNLPDSSMIATRIGSVRIVACASPSYIAKNGEPKSPADLSNHDCITVDDLAVQRTWKFEHQGREIVAPISSKLTVNTSEAAIAAAVAGAGIARVMAYKMESARQEGKLIVLLDDFERPPLPVHIVYQERKPLPLKLRAFLNWMAPRLRECLSP